MNIVYIIHERNLLKVPFTNYNPTLFSRVRSLNAGYWDASSCQFILPGGFADMISASFSSFIRIETSKIPDYPIEVKGFLGRPWGCLPAPPGRDPPLMRETKQPPLFLPDYSLHKSAQRSATNPKSSGHARGLKSAIKQPKQMFSIFLKKFCAFSQKRTIHLSMHK